MLIISQFSNKYRISLTKKQKYNKAMKNINPTLIYGFLIWLTPFIASNFIFLLRQSDRYFFETLMTLILVSTTCFLLTKYIQKNPITSLKEGFIIGLVWTSISLSLDFLIFIIGPLAMPPINYLKEIGLDYLSVPTITTMIGAVVQRMKDTTKSV